MPDILLSYSHKDRERVRPMVTLLENEGWEVWWDRDIEPGKEWSPSLDFALAKTRAVLVVWSKFSQKSDWVHKEANIGVQKNGFAQVSIDLDSLPETFNKFQCVDLVGWKGRGDLDEINALLRRLNEIVPPSRIDLIRPGFDPSFLGADIRVDLPGVTGSAAIFPYLNFSIVMNPGRRMAHYAAYNINGAQLASTSRIREEAKWIPDPLLPESLQMSLSLLHGSEFDRGHLISPSSVSWGDTRSAGIAGRQSYYWTNVSPQTKSLNQKSWLAIEQFERKVAKKREKVIGFSGIVFTPKDKPFRDRVEFKEGLVAVNTFQIPQAFWKVILSKDAEGNLISASFLVKQDDPSPTNYKDILKYRVSFKDIETNAHVSFSDKIYSALPLSDDSIVELLE